jgi:outer membrane lipopolysaccharide assembly protein LptE/RlpB
MEAAHQYASCLGATSASTDVATGSIDVAIKVAFQSCAPLRKVAVTEITKGFQARGMKFVAASKEAEDFVQEMDQQTAKQLRADIAALRAKKQVSNAPNN